MLSPFSNLKGLHVNDFNPVRMVKLLTILKHRNTGFCVLGRNLPKTLTLKLETSKLEL